MKSRGRRAQARADARRIANVRRELVEKARRERRRKIKNEEHPMTVNGIPTWAEFARTEKGVYRRTLIPAGWVAGPELPTRSLSNDELLAEGVTDFYVMDPARNTPRP